MVESLVSEGETKQRHVIGQKEIECMRPTQR
jgi:hypothetical protein